MDTIYLIDFGTGDSQVTQFFKTISSIIISSMLFVQGQMQQKFKNKHGKIMVMLESSTDIINIHRDNSTIIS